MRVTVEIDEKQLASIRQSQRLAFLDLVMEGQTDYVATNDEVELWAHREFESIGLP